MIELNVNGKSVEVDVNPSTPILWVLRDTIGITGTKFGCGVSQCGACTIHMDGNEIRSCVTPVSQAEGKEIVTIEGLEESLKNSLRQAWAQVDVPQCGYCQSGQIMTAAVLIRDNPDPSDADIDIAMNGNICRCGTYQRIRTAIHIAARLKREN